MSFASISAAINDLKVKGSRKGVSRSAIKAALGDVTAARVNAALKKCVASGKIIQDKESFKVRALFCLLFVPCNSTLATLGTFLAT